MSHQASRDAYHPNTHSTHPPHLDAYVSPLNALSNHSASPYTASSSNSIPTNRLIPRDYLPSSRPRPVPVDGSNARSSPLVSDTGNTAPSDANQSASKYSASNLDDSAQPVRTYSGGAKRKVHVFRKHSEADEGLEQARTRSLESVETSISVESTALDSKPVDGSSSRSFHNMPRTSSIDSAISSVSTSSTLQKGQGDVRDPSPATIRGLIATAGSVENLVLHLLRDKNHLASQNNQLWNLVEKQRTLLFGLNKDLERVTKERDRYKKKLKEVHSHGALPRAATQSPSREHSGDNAVKPPELPHRDDTPQQSTLESTPRDSNSPVETPAIPSSTVQESVPPSQSNSRRPTLQAQTAGLAQPTFALTEATPSIEKSSKGFPSRKAPPKPLNLIQSSTEPHSQDLVNPVDQTALVNGDEDEPRGRRKTREDDDRDREKSLMKEQEARSKSKKQSVKASDTHAQKTDHIPTVNVMLPSTPRPQGLAPSSAVLAGQSSSVQERLIALPLRSPGLPASPRPMIQNTPGLSALPMSPRAALTPLSPRAPKQPIPPPMMSPSPFADPVLIQRQNAMARATAAAQAAQSNQPPDRLQIHEPSTSNEIPIPYQGLVSPSYPNLLLPPNALPSIQVKVASSRLRPSRHSMLGLRTQEESTVFSLSIYSRASRNELWRIEKIPASLPHLEQQLRQRCNDLPRIPERKLFNGHSPATIDARRQALDTYFEDLLDMEIDEQSALIICRFLSEDVLDPTKESPTYPGVHQESLPQNTSLSGKVVKTGFLTKRGKNFGGWKTRYFVLDSPELKYYDNPGGPQIGTIRLAYARIGSQKVDESANNDQEDQYRHAFLIQEPKKKDSNNFMRHVLCAESDPDRDQWVAALLHYVEESGQKDSASPKLSVSASPFASRSTIQQTTNPRERTNRAGESQSNTPSPTSPASVTDSSSITETLRKTPISAPVNGKPISDLNEWNNRPTTQQMAKDKTSRVTNIFHFKKGSQEQLYQGGRQQETNSKPRILRHNGYVRAVFGLALADAVEYCSPFNVDVGLPAVVYRSIEYLRFRKAANEEGLFRLSGSNIVVKTLKERFNTEGDIDLTEDKEYYDVHAVASLFKQYLRELPSPLLTRDLHIEFLRVLELETQAEKVAMFNTLVHQLPQVNFQLVRAMSEYLLEVTENSGKNKMSIRNMGIVFSPTVNIPTPVFNLFLSEFDAIFLKDPQQQLAEQSPIQTTELHVPTGLSPDDIRSPRHQILSNIPTPEYSQTSFSEEQPRTNTSPTTGHQTSGSGEFGFTPIHPSYENGQYVTMPGEVPRTQAYAPPAQVQQGHEQEYTEEQFNSLNGMIQPGNSTNDKRRKRGSVMLF